MRSSLYSVAAMLAASTLVACSGDTFTPGAGVAAGGAGAAGSTGGGASNGGNAGAAPIGGSGGGAQAGASGGPQAGTGGASPGGASGGGGAGNAGGGLGGQGGAGAGAAAGAGGGDAGSAGSGAGGGQQGGSAGLGGMAGSGGVAGSGGGAGGGTSACSVLYVSAAAGDSPANDGCTPSTALRSLGKAFVAAKASPNVEQILVCAGSYSETNLKLEASVAVRGGYDCNTWIVPPGQPDVLATVIGFTGGTGLTLVDDLSAKTEIERIHFENRNTTNTRITGIFVGKNAVKLRNVRVTTAIEASEAKGGLYASAGLFVSEDASPDIRDSHFEGGPGNSTGGPGSVGVWLNGSTPGLVFEGNDAIGGLGDTDSDELPGSAGMVIVPHTGVTELRRLARVEGGQGHSTKKPTSQESALATVGIVIRPPSGGPTTTATVALIESSVDGGVSRAIDGKLALRRDGYTRGIDAAGKGLTVEIVRSRIYGGDHAGSLPEKSLGVSTKTEAIRIVDGKVTATSSLLHAGGLGGGTYFPRAIALEGSGASFRGRYVTVLTGKLPDDAQGGPFNGGNAVLGLVKAEATSFDLFDSLVVALAPNTAAFYGQHGACSAPYFVNLTRTRYVHPETSNPATKSVEATFLGGIEACTPSASMPLTSATIGTAKLTIDNALHVGDAAGQAPTDSTIDGCTSSLACATTIFPEALNGGTREQVLARQSSPYTPACTLGAGIATTADVDASKVPDLMNKQRTAGDKMLGALIPTFCSQ